MVINLFIIETFALVREVLHNFLNGKEEIIVQGMADKYDRDLPVLGLCNVLLLEHGKNITDTLTILSEITEHYPNLKVILLAEQFDEPLHLHRLMSVGIKGYVTKGTSSDELIYAIKTAFSNEIFVSTKFVLEFLERLLPRIKAKAITIPIPELSTGEKKVLNLISEGLTNKEIANKLHISVRTIETRRKKLLDKTNTTNTATLIKFCIKSGLINI